MIIWDKTAIVRYPIILKVKVWCYVKPGLILVAWRRGQYFPHLAPRYMTPCHPKLPTDRFHIPGPFLTQGQYNAHETPRPLKEKQLLAAQWVKERFSATGFAMGGYPVVTFQSISSPPPLARRCEAASNPIFSSLPWPLHCLSHQADVFSACWWH